MQLLCFRFAKAAYAVALDDVSEVAPATAIRDVPGAPPGVRGLASRHGRAVTVLDGPRLLDDIAIDLDAAYLVRFRAPNDGIALWVPSRIATEVGTPANLDSDAPASRGCVLASGEPHILLDLEALVRAVAA